MLLKDYIPNLNKSYNKIFFFRNFFWKL